uniref:Uncharacterized protein n=1 Tax=Oryza glumipatula TaxID=40148 RepID=A0A0D9YQP8_9ORYZ
MVRRSSRTPQPELLPPLDSSRLTDAHQATALPGVRRSRCRHGRLRHPFLPAAASLATGASLAADHKNGIALASRSQNRRPLAQNRPSPLPASGKNANVGPIVEASEISVPGGDGLYDYIEPEDHEEEDACEDPVDPLEWDNYGFY